jgi:hypothetical protein
MLQRYAHQAGNNVVEKDQLRGTVGSFDPNEDFSGLRIIMNTDAKGTLAGDFDFLGDVLTTGRERKPLTHDVSSSSEMTSGPALSSESESWLRLVADLPIICRVLPRSAELSAGSA